MDTIFDDHNTLTQLKKIEGAFLALASDNSIIDDFPTIATAAKDYVSKSSQGYNDDTEIAFLNLYCEIHRSGSVYSSNEREQLDKKNGYFNHPGGISPLLHAKPYIDENTVLADLGAGNGLQGLLFQYLYPHQQTLQVELSTEMIHIGKKFQKALKIPEDKVRWVNDNIMNFELDEIDFLYLYRPSKPIKDGIALYKNLQAKLSNRNRSLTIFSIADCLKDFLPVQYKEFYNDGHLTCFSLDC
ncbi:class I SAM-dependent methyltransferase [bacterium]|nr:class I SAM-dependent methyltransferase [bacterium]